jgi:hypothetical protein
VHEWTTTILACKFYWPRELRNHLCPTCLFFVGTNTFHKFICCCSWVMGTSKPTSNTMGVQNRFCETPKNGLSFCLCFCFILICFHCYMENPPLSLSRITQKNLSWFEISYLRLMCDIKSFSKVCWKNRKEFGGICQNVWES